jgi:hypothetical protein
MYSLDTESILKPQKKTLKAKEGKAIPVTGREGP